MNYLLKQLKDRRERTRGFSLIELIIVVAILGVLVAVAIPTYGAIQDTAARTATQKVANSVYTGVKEFTTNEGVTDDQIALSKAADAYRQQNPGDEGYALSLTRPAGSENYCITAIYSKKVSITADAPNRIMCAALKADPSSTTVTDPVTVVDPGGSAPGSDLSVFLSYSFTIGSHDGSRYTTKITSPSGKSLGGEDGVARIEYMSGEYVVYEPKPWFNANGDTYQFSPHQPIVYPNGNYTITLTWADTGEAWRKTIPFSAFTRNYVRTYDGITDPVVPAGWYSEGWGVGDGTPVEITASTS